MPLRVLLEGRPGSGKTTAAARLADLLQARGVAVRGFVTHEVREESRRVGFEIASIDGSRATLAHVSLPGPPRVGKYGVDVSALEEVALPALERPPRTGVVVIDELGKMELASEAFCDAVQSLLERAVDLVATVHVFRHPFTDALKRREDIEVLRVTKASRGALPEQLANRLSR